MHNATFFFFGTFQALTILTISHLIMKFQVDLRSALQKSFSKNIDSSGLIYFFPSCFTRWIRIPAKVMFFTNDAACKKFQKSINTDGAVQ